jgi:type II secretory pathway predicted ATPase ExeA
VIEPLSPQGSVSDPSTLTYEPHFGLREKPFSLSTNPRFFFRGMSRAAAFSDLLDRKTFSAFVPDPIVTREDLLKALLIDFGIASPEEIRAGHLRGLGRTELSFPLHEFLVSLQPLHAFAVLIIDEAQNLPDGLLEEIRILSELEHQGAKLLQLVLVGQPEFEEKLAAPEMSQLRQRVSVRCSLGPLPTEDVGSYIAHRLTIAGAPEPLFNERAIPLIAVASGGIPRLINLLCDRALTHAAAEGVRSVVPKHVINGAGDLKLPLFRVEPLWWETEKTRPKEPAASIPASETPTHLDPHPEPLAAAADPAVMDALKTFKLTPQRRRSPVPALAALGLLAVVTAGVTYVTLRPAAAPETSTAERAGGQTQPPAVQRDAKPAPPEPKPASPSPAAAPSPAGTGSVPTASGAQAPLTAGALRVQIATFRTASRAAEAVTLFEGAGFRARSAEVVLRDGRTAFSVQLGPYADRPAALAAIERAQAIPGYGPGVIIEPKPRVPVID